MKRGILSSAPDYTTAALVMGFVNLLWIFMVIWAIFGFPAVLLTGLALDALIRRIGPRAGA